MRRIIEYYTDRYLGRISSNPSLKAGNIVRLGKVNYRVISVSLDLKEIWVLGVSWAATPDHRMELKK